MQGAQASPLRKENWVYALDREGMYRTIMFGIVNTEMIAWSQILSKEQGNALTDHILESQSTPPDRQKPFPKQDPDTGLSDRRRVSGNRGIWHLALGY